MLSSLLIGGLFILLGTVWLFANIFKVDLPWDIMWPFFLIVPGVALWFSYFSNPKRDHEVLIPANILLFLGGTFLFNMIVSNYLHYSDVWVATVAMYSTGPVAIAFWITWAASRKPGYMVPAIILTLITFCIASITLPIALFNQVFFGKFWNVMWPLFIIMIGVFIIFVPIFKMLTKEPGKEEESLDDKIDKWADKFGDGVANAVENMFGDDAEARGKKKEELEKWGNEIGKKIEKFFDGEVVDADKVDEDKPEKKPRDEDGTSK